VYAQNEIAISARLAGLGADICPDMSKCSVVVSQRVRNEVQHLSWEQK